MYKPASGHCCLKNTLLINCVVAQDQKENRRSEASQVATSFPLPAARGAARGRPAATPSEKKQEEEEEEEDEALLITSFMCCQVLKL